MAGGDSFPGIFRRLRAILSLQVPPLVVTADRPGEFVVSVDRPDVPEARRYFGGVTLRKNYVSYYLIGVYSQPSLVDDLSPGLRKRMQGKSCFNFNRIDEELLAELTTLTERTVKVYPEVLDRFLAGRLG